MTARIDSFVPPHEVAIAQTRASRNLSQMREAVIQGYDLSPPEWLILGYVVGIDRGEGIKVGDIARVLDVQATYVTGTLRRLLEKNLVQAKVLSSDRRVRCIVATKHGSAVVQAINAELGDKMDKRLIDVSDTALKNYLEVLAILAGHSS